MSDLLPFTGQEFEQAMTRVNEGHNFYYGYHESPQKMDGNHPLNEGDIVLILSARFQKYTVYKTYDFKRMSRGRLRKFVDVSYTCDGINYIRRIDVDQLYHDMDLS